MEQIKCLDFLGATFQLDGVFPMRYSDGKGAVWWSDQMVL